MLNTVIKNGKAEVSRNDLCLWRTMPGEYDFGLMAELKLRGAPILGTFDMWPDEKNYKWSSYWDETKTCLVFEWNHIQGGVKPKPTPTPSGYKAPPVTSIDVESLLLLVGHHVPFDLIELWSQEEREQVADWAAACHVRASDNDHVKIPPRPAILNNYFQRGESYES